MTQSSRKTENADVRVTGGSRYALVSVMIFQIKQHELGF